jgi:hypothetical protein
MLRHLILISVLVIPRRIMWGKKVSSFPKRAAGTIIKSKTTYSIDCKTLISKICVENNNRYYINIRPIPPNAILNHPYTITNPAQIAAMITATKVPPVVLLATPVYAAGRVASAPLSPLLAPVVLEPADAGAVLKLAVELPALYGGVAMVGTALE